MHIRLKTNMAGPDGSFRPGDVVDFERGRAYDLIERGYAEQVEADAPRIASEPAVIETASITPPQLAILPRHRKGRR